MEDEMPAVQWDQAWSVSEKMDFMNWRLGVLDTKIEDLFERLNAVGQMTANIDGFCREVRATVEGMSKNPMMRAMTGIPKPGGIVIPGQQSG